MRTQKKLSKEVKQIHSSTKHRTELQIIKNYILVSCFFGFVVFLYFHNLTRDIYSGDTGDLVTSAYVFGVPHPPGYPLLTFLGFVFSRLPLSLPVVTKVGLISVLSCLLGLILFYRFSLKVTQSIILSILTTAILAFSYEFWILGELPEVFALNNFFVIALLFCSYQFFETKKRNYFYFLTFLAGLSLTNQLQIISILPFVFLLSLYQWQVIWEKNKTILYASFCFLLGFLPYLYIPFAAARHPVISWDDASSFQNFFHLVLRQDYKIFTPHAWFLTPKEKLPILMDYFRSFGDNYSWIIVFVGLLGLLFLFKISKKLLFVFLLLFLVSGPFFVFIIAAPIKSSDAIGVLERFYVLSFVVYAFFLPFGFLFLKSIFSKILNRQSFVFTAIGIFFIIPILMIVYQYPKTNLSETHIGNQLGIRILQSIPKNHSVLFLHGDNMTFNTWYVHYVLGIRSDITLASITETGNTQFEDVLIHRYMSAHKGSLLPRDKILGIMLPKILSGEAVFSTAPIQYPFPKGFAQIPVGLTFQLIPEKDVPVRKDYLRIVLPWLKEADLPRRETLSSAEQNLITPDITRFYSDAFQHIGDFLFYRYGDVNYAEAFYQRAIYIDNENTTAYANLASLESLSSDTCSLAEKNIRQAIDYYQIYRPYYDALYHVYKRCKASESVLKAIRNEYIHIYRKDIEKLPMRFDLFS